MTNRSIMVSQIFAAISVSPAFAHFSHASFEELSFTVEPGQGVEINLVVTAGALVEFSWSVEDGLVSYDLHGDGGGNEISYQKDRGVKGHDGMLEAAFDGNHGWSWRNRGAEAV